MKSLIVALVIAAVLILILLALAVRIVRQYEQGVVFRLGGCADREDRDCG
jgi:regulator of protease activity HflC (stomatin/prohibitin superfamily)